MLFALLGFEALAAGVETTVVVSSDVAIDSHSQRADEDTVEAYTRLHARTRGPEGRWFLSLNGTHTVLLGEDHEVYWTLEPGESGWNHPIGAQQVRAGLLVERWGRLDLLPVLDVLNGRDLRQGPLTPPERIRIPAPMAQIQFNSWNPRVEVSWLPFSSLNRISYSGTDWSLLQQGMLTGLLSEASMWEGDALTTSTGQQSLAAINTLIDGALPAQERSLNHILSADALPANGLNGDLAIRMETSVQRIDMGVVGGWMQSRTSASTLPSVLLPYLQNERLPNFDEQEELYSAAENSIGPIRPAGAFAGGEINGIVGMVGVRAEGIWEQRVVVTQQWMQASVSPRVQGAIGLDWSRGTNFLISAEARWSHLLESVPNMWLMTSDHIQLAATLNLMTMSDRIAIQTSSIYDITFSEMLLQPSIRWRIDDQYEVGIGGLILSGASPVPTRFLDAMIFQGGPLGYWSFNDNFIVSVKRIW